MSTTLGLTSVKKKDEQHRLPKLMLTALGVVYGDIGTSPLYAFREALRDAGTVNDLYIIGILSMIFWSLIVIVSIKYLLVVLRADNQGEGGILALIALLKLQYKSTMMARTAILFAIGVFGAALLYGDGMITPAISVLSALEGLEVTGHGLTHFIVPLAVIILAGLFLLQRKGTSTVGSLFGPVMLLWFGAMAVLGVYHIAQNPQVLAALKPGPAIGLIVNHMGVAFIILGAVFLAVTGSEALYADMGHIGRLPIQLAWFCYVLPCLVLNYFGQGALVLASPNAASQPFFLMTPDWALYPYVVLATLATIIASQAVITGAFSLTRQAVQLGLLPPFGIKQTSSEEIGEVYVPSTNVALAIGSIGLVLGFGTSSALAGAYGIAISVTMFITTILLFEVFRRRWKWPLVLSAVVTLIFLSFETAYLTSNGLKLFHGGWVPVAVGAFVFIMMTTWHGGRRHLERILRTERVSDEEFLASLKNQMRVPGCAVFFSSEPDVIPRSLVQHLEHNQVLHETVVIVTVKTLPVPYVGTVDRGTVVGIGQGIYRLTLNYGFMQTPNVPVGLRLAAEMGVPIDFNKLTYYLARVIVIPTEHIVGLPLWQESLFAFMAQNSWNVPAFFRLPPERVVELGMPVEI